MDAPNRHRLDGPDGLKRGPSQDEAAGGGGGHEILLVEDNPGDVALFREAIDESDVRGVIHVATTGDDALSMIDGGDGPASGTSIDLVVLDLDLPDKPGFAVLEELKEDPTVRTTPVVVLSTSDDRGEVQRAYELGANAYLVKRMRFADTVAVLDALGAFWFGVAELPE